ncbi:hypothetical protein F5Y15DRAFT_366177 [Xylariaceae sp. FL0016]|nr:hypothetical protein F5Y15DRAFT_366177 [Xylariaceae sp. FL0016]
MRPLAGDDAWIGRHRPNDSRCSPLASTTTNRMSFVLANEASVDSYLEQPTLPPRSRDPHKYPEPVAGALSSRNDDGGHARKRTEYRDDDRSCSPSSRASVFSHSPASVSAQDHAEVSRPITPIMLGTSCTGSVLSSPSPRRNSLTNSISDHAISFDDELLDNTSSLDILDSSSAPQLVMPSIIMPSRRPFTEAGKNIGRLKVLLAGDSGVGKTSLLKAIVQACDDIVHVDLIPSYSDSGRRISGPQDITGTPKSSLYPTSDISEIYASTKPYPEWWSELDNSRASQRRKSLGDSVLERNICFVDTPGFGRGSSVLETIIPCVEYVESQLNKVLSDSLSDSDMLSMLGGDGGCQVDVVLYLISHKVKPADVEYVRRLSHLTNVIPLLAQSDKLESEQIIECKQDIAGQLHNAGIRAFQFVPASTQECTASRPAVPYAVSNANGSDHDIMDASVLMNSAYVQPLVQTELSFVIENVFSPSGASWLRHAAAKKYISWRVARPSRPHHLYRPLSLPRLGYPSDVERVSASNWALSRVRGAQGQCTQAQLHIVDWATDLERSLASDRTRYEALARGERAVWLTEMLSECVQDGTLVAVNSRKEARGGRRRRSSRYSNSRTQPHQDPLGLVQVAADLKCRGRFALEFLGTLGVIGGMAFWICRHTWRVEPLSVVDEWPRFFHG